MCIHGEESRLRSPIELHLMFSTRIFRNLGHSQHFHVAPCPRTFASVSHSGCHGCEDRAVEWEGTVVLIDVYPEMRTIVR